MLWGDKMLNEKITQLREKAMKLPLLPGVYIMKDSSDNIIYIGKAKALKNRVSQYFGSPRNHPEKVRRMVSNVDHFEYIITDSEFEALVLECSLIKQHTPKYNILLKDDKGYSYIRISPGDWKRISEAKQKADDGAEYIGPYTSSWFVKNAVDEAQKIFKIPTCNRRFPQDFGKGRPCLNYHIKQCVAPCTGKVKKSDYDEIIGEAIEFLKGGSGTSIKELTERMNEAAENLEFERAARIRDRITAVKRMNDKQKVVASKVEQQDIIAFVRDGTGGCFEVFRFNSGRLYDRESFLLKEVGTPEEERSEFIKRYYAMRNNVPPIIAVDGDVDDSETIEQWLTQKLGKRVRITVPQKGDQAKLVDMCRTNAAERLAQSKGSTVRETSALDELAQLLGLDRPPEYIESYDISNTGGSENVAGMIVFKDGRPYKSAYRKFMIKGFEGQDDYASMNEVLSRRFDEYEKNKDSGDGFGRLPDLILLDGGKGQVSAVEPILRERGLDIPLFGMVKDDKHRTRAITGDGGEIAISSKRRVFTLVSSIQDEVHRFAIGYHRQKRKNNTIRSTLTDIPGIGASRAAALLKHFKTVRRVSEADLAELENTPTMNKPAAQAVYDYFRGITHSSDIQSDT